MTVRLSDLIKPEQEALLRAAVGAPSDSTAELEVKADAPSGLEHKADPGLGGAQVLSADDETGVVEALVSITGVEDRVKDIIEPGAYTKTIGKHEPIGVWSHDDKTWVARTEHAQELMPGDLFFKGLTTMDGEPWPAEAGAVKVKARFNLETPHGKAAYSDVKFFQGKTGWSIGYRATKAHRNPRTGVRHIKELDWFEYSPVMVGAASQPMTLSVKSMAQPVDADDTVGLVDDGVLEVLSAPEVKAFVELRDSLGLEVKDRVRTAAGVARYGQPIGSVIIPDTLNKLPAGDLSAGMEVDFQGMGPGGPSDPKPVKGKVTKVSRSGGVTTVTVNGEDHKLRDGSPVEVTAGMPKDAPIRDADLATMIKDATAKGDAEEVRILRGVAGLTPEKRRAALTGAGGSTSGAPQSANGGVKRSAKPGGPGFSHLDGKRDGHDMSRREQAQMREAFDRAGFKPGDSITVSDPVPGNSPRTGELVKVSGAGVTIKVGGTEVEKPWRRIDGVTEAGASSSSGGDATRSGSLASRMRAHEGNTEAAAAAAAKDSPVAKEFPKGTEVTFTARGKEFTGKVTGHEDNGSGAKVVVDSPEVGKIHLDPDRVKKAGGSDDPMDGPDTVDMSDDEIAAELGKLHGRSVSDPKMRERAAERYAELSNERTDRIREGSWKGKPVAGTPRKVIAKDGQLAVDPDDKPAGGSGKKPASKPKPKGPDYGPAPEGVDKDAWAAANDHSLDGLDPEGEDRRTFDRVADEEGVDRDKLVAAAGAIRDDDSPATRDAELAAKFKGDTDSSVREERDHQLDMVTRVGRGTPRGKRAEQAATDAEDELERRKRERAAPAAEKSPAAKRFEGAKSSGIKPAMAKDREAKPATGAAGGFPGWKGQTTADGKYKLRKVGEGKYAIFDAETGRRVDNSNYSKGGAALAVKDIYARKAGADPKNPEAARERDQRADRAASRERSADAAADAKTKEREKLAAVNRRRKARGQAPLLRLPDSMKSIDLAEWTDVELDQKVFDDPTAEVIDDPDDLEGKAAPSLDRSPRQNWVEKNGDLPPYIREVAAAIERDQGLSLDRAIPIAIGRIKKWAAGGGGVDADTVAKAVKTVAQWEALKARAGHKFDSDLLEHLEHKTLAAMDEVDRAWEVLADAGELDTALAIALDDELGAVDEKGLPVFDDDVLDMLTRAAELKSAVDMDNLFTEGAEFKAGLPDFS